MSKEVPSSSEERSLPPELREQARDLVGDLVDELRQIIEAVRELKPAERTDLDNRAYRRATFDPKNNEGVKHFLDQLRKARTEKKNTTIVRSDGMIELWVDILTQ